MKTYIKYIILATVNYLLVGAVQAQTNSHNYVQTLTPKNAYTGAAVETNKNDPAKVANTINYFDGLGRHSQTVQYKISSSTEDLVLSVEYDDYGRQAKDYLPYPATGTAGSYRTGAASGANSYYGDIAYSKKEFEPSPLNRVVEQAAPGSAWSGHEITYSYRTNTTSEGVRIWTISGERPISASAYNAGELYVNETTDEEGNRTIEYVDKLNRMVLKKAQAAASPSTSHSGWACTYYVYDDYDQLRFVIPPEAVREMSESSWSKAATDDVFFYHYLFAYNYDVRLRMIEKKVPGADWVYMVYDKRDRLVLTQDGVQRGITAQTVSGGNIDVAAYAGKSYVINSSSSVTLKPGFQFNGEADGEFFVSATNQAVAGKWLFTKYDALNRPAMTGIVELSGTRAEIQTAVDNFGTKSENYVGSGPFEGYTNVAYPTSFSSADLLTVTYYDQYNFPYAISNSLLPRLGYTTASVNQRVAGQVTGGKVRNLTTNAWLNSVTYYDDKYRIIQTIADHHLSGKDIATTTYHFDGRAIKTERLHQKGGSATTVLEEYLYDHAGRLSQVKHSVDGATPVTLAANTYNKIGELTQKSLHGTMQQVNYEYNIRGWLTKINGGTAVSGTDKFGLELKYNAVETAIGNKPLYNGNISAMIWRNVGDGTNGKAYKYEYDPLNRLTQANYYQKATSWSDAGTFDVENLKYDLNGNIQSIRRYGPDGGRKEIDDLSYTYANNNLSNRLIKVDDDQGDDGFKDGTNSGDDYEYDRNGNLVKDLNKGITNIAYNHLNLPEEITRGSDYIKYAYDAAGVKLKKEVKQGATTTTTDYVNGIQYLNGALDFIQTPEGRWKPGAGYEYDLKDHLGNTRVTLNQSGAVIQREDYYPFGMTYSMAVDQTVGDNKYLYNGKELQNELGLETYAYEFRMYDPALGRWWQPDPVIKENMSPYAWVTNNPIRYFDVLGLDSAQRAQAVAKAQEYVNKNPGESYEKGAKGGPGENVDCSGVVSACVVAGGEEDPINKGTGNGVSRIAENTKTIPESEVVPGSVVILDGKSHTGLITVVERDKDGNITTLKMIDSGGTKGPRNTTLIEGGDKKYWGNRIDGFRKWDTKPDKPTSTNTNSGNSSNSRRGLTDTQKNELKGALLKILGVIK